MDQDEARTLARNAQRLARQVAAEATEHGCSLTNCSDPDVAELIVEAARVGMHVSAAYARAS